MQLLYRFDKIICRIDNLVSKYQDSADTSEIANPISAKQVERGMNRQGAHLVETRIPCVYPGPHLVKFLCCNSDRGW